MSLNLIRNNSSSPFRLQRSMVDQGGEGGAYESGGYTGKSEYSDGGLAESISTFGTVVGAGLSSRTAGDKNKANIKKADRLEAREAKTKVKKENALKSGNTDKAARMEKIETRVETRKDKTKAEIKKYEESQKPTTKSDITAPVEKTKAPPVIPSAVTEKTVTDRTMSTASGDDNLVDPNEENKYMISPVKQVVKKTPIVSDMIGMPGTAFRRKVEAEIKEKSNKEKLLPKFTSTKQNKKEDIKAPTTKTKKR
jgi:hypothetical protein